jgi:hypothetical protein
MNQYEMTTAITQMLKECADAQMREVQVSEKMLADGTLAMTVVWQIMGTEKTYQIQIKEVPK